MTGECESTRQLIVQKVDRPPGLLEGRSQDEQESGWWSALSAGPMRFTSRNRVAGGRHYLNSAASSARRFSTRTDLEARSTQLGIKVNLGARKVFLDVLTH